MSARRALAVLVVLVVGCFVPCASALGIEGVENVITQWNAVTQRIVRLLAIPNQIAARVYLQVHLPQYQALQQTYEKRGSDAYAEASAHYAAHYALSELFPWQQSSIFDGFIASKLTGLGLSEEENREAQKIGVTAASKFVKSRVNDGSQEWANFQPAPANSSVGRYQFTPNQTFALYPQLATTRPEVIKAAKDFDSLGGPPEISSYRYLSDYQTVATVGDANSPLQTAYQKETARFWEDGGNTSGIVGHLFNMSLAVTGPEISLKETAKLFAKLSVAHYDGSIAGWYQKYKYRFWRPVTAIRQGDPKHVPIPSFEPYLRTPAHPEYPSTHSVNAGVWASVVSKYLGISRSAKVPRGSYEVATEGYLLPTRTYSTIDGSSIEIYLSRVYGGMHFPKAGKDGLQLGIMVGDFVYDHFEEVYGVL